MQAPQMPQLGAPGGSATPSPETPSPAVTGIEPPPFQPETDPGKIQQLAATLAQGPAHAAQASQMHDQVSQMKAAQQGPPPGMPPGGQPMPQGGGGGGGPDYPVFEGTGPGGQKMRFDSGAGMQSLKAEREQLANDALEAAKDMPPAAAQRVKTMAPMVRVGLMSPQDFRAVFMGLAQQENQAAIATGKTESAEKIAAGHDAARLAAAAKKRGGGAGGGGLKAATPVIKQMTEGLKEFTAKGGPRERLMHSESALHALEQNPNNPVEWTNAIDSMIRTNTGRAAIKAQYDLYTSHAHGQVDTFDTWVEKLKSGLPSPEQRKNLLAALRSSNSELRREAHDTWENFRKYDQDPAVARNRYVREGYQRMERDVFGKLPGYQQSGQATPAINPLLRAGAIEAARKRMNDPKETPESKAQAQAFLKRMGV
jgi:hypothetical protein